VQRLLLFAVGIVPACAGIATLNAIWYGSPLNTGRQPLGEIYYWENLWPNVLSYSRWLIETETPIVLLAVAAPFVLGATIRNGSAPTDRRSLAITYCSFIAGTFASYVLFRQFDAWWYLRYLLPAFPPLVVLTSVVLVAVANRWLPAARTMAVALLIGAVAWQGINYSRHQGVFEFREGERKYAAVGQYIGRRLPERGVFLAMQHSGSVRYYSGRPTVRYDLVPPQDLDSVVADLQRLGYHPYIVLENWEEEIFRGLFRTHSPLAALDWPPVAMLQHATVVRIYDAARGQEPGGPPRPATETFH
jgi:hypothetical protein